jgi:hypothetical protein
MDEAPSQPGSSRASGATPAVSPTESGWDEYYREASRRRRRNGGGQQLRDQKRRRRIRERLGIVLSVMLVGAMTGVFYLVLR